MQLYLSIISWPFHVYRSLGFSVAVHGSVLDSLEWLQSLYGSIRDFKPASEPPYAPHTEDSCVLTFCV